MIDRLITTLVWFNRFSRYCISNINGMFIGAILLSLSSRAISGELPVQCSGNCGSTNLGWVQSGSASLSTSGNTMQIDQHSDKVQLNWQTFNIGASNSVRFNQPNSNSVALNRVWDPSSNPTRILGTLKANGQVYIVNRNGVVFGQGAKVDVHGLVASTMDVDSDIFEAGLAQAYNQGDPAFKAEDARAYILDANGNEAKFKVEKGKFVLDENGKLMPDENGEHYPIAVVLDSSDAKGAQIKTDSGGRVMLLGSSVAVGKHAKIETPDGQTILAAGNKVYLQTSSDLRGFLVEVDVDAINDTTQLNDLLTTNKSPDAGNVVNLGTISAPRGNVSMVGLAINQQGRVSATTAVNSNGSIRLMARSGVHFYSGSNQTDSYIDTIYHTGRINFGEDSVSEISLDTETADVAQPDATAIDGNQIKPAKLDNPSKLDAMGAIIDMQKGSAIVAPSGEVNLTAVKLPLQSASTPIVKDDEIGVHLAEGSRIDVSGTQVELSMESNVIEAELRGNELADSPLQRDSEISGKKVKIDVRTINVTDGKADLPIANVQGAVDNIKRTVAERSVTGGNVTIKSVGSVDIESGAKIDVSGGATNYKSGIINTTHLLSNGRIYDISEADPNIKYDNILGTLVHTNNKWGTKQQWYTQEGTGGRYEQGYVQGADAGTVQLSGYEMNIVGADLIGKTVAGRYQRSNQPKGGTLVIGDDTWQTLPGGANYFVPHVLFAQDEFIAALQQGVADNTALWPKQTVILNTDMFDRGGFTQANLFSNGKITLDTDINIAPGGSLSLTAPEIEINHDITIPAGAININSSSVSPQFRLNASNSDPLPVGSLNPQNNGQLTIADNVTFDVEGTWANDTADNPLSGRSVDYSAPTMIDGGDIQFHVNSKNGGLTIGDNVVMQASGGAWITDKGQLKSGNGGDIELEIGNERGFDIGKNLQLLSFGLQKGGTLSFNAPRIIVAGSDQLSPAEQQQIWNQGQKSFITQDEKGTLTTFIFTAYQNAVNQLASGTDDVTNLNKEDIAVLMLKQFRADGQFKDIRVSDNVFYQEILLPIAEQLNPADSIDAVNPTAAQLAIVSVPLSSSHSLELPAQLFQQGGFSSYNVAANTGDLRLLADTHIKLSPRNYLPSSDFYNKPNNIKLSQFASVGQLTPYLQTPVNLRLAAEITVDNEKYPQLIVPDSAIIESYVPGANISLSSNGSVDMGGKIVAPVGNIYIEVNRNVGNGADDKYRKQRGIILEDTAELSATGTTVLKPNNEGRRFGKVLDGGKISLTAAGGFVDIRKGAKMDVSGVQSDLDVVVIGGNSQSNKLAAQDVEQRRISSSAGELAITASEWLRADGNFQAQRGGDGAAGGRLSVTLDRQIVDDTKRETVDSDPTKNWVTKDQATWTLNLIKDFPSDSGSDALPVGSGELSVAQIQAGGFDAVDLFTSSRLSVEAGTALRLGRSLKIDTPIIEVAGAAPNSNGADVSKTVQFDAPYIALGPDPTGERPRKEGAPTSGDGELSIGGDNTHFIDLLGSTVVQGVSNTTVSSQGDVRLRAVDGSFAVSGDMTIASDQVYTSTLSTFRLASIGENSTITFERKSDTTPTPVLSAGGKLTVNASTINQNGVVKAPLGELTFETTAGAGQKGTINLGPDSVTSTAADVSVIPFGETINGGDEWHTVINNTDVPVFDENGLGRVPQQKLVLKADDIGIDDSATTDISGGGDLVAFEFLPGPGGSQDFTSPDVAQGEQTYAILPWLKDQYAPYDWSISSGWDLEMGKSVRLMESVNGLAAGTYTLLPARYALLPGAFVVTHVNGYDNIQPGRQIKMADGTTLTPGVFTISNTDIESQLNTAFAVRKSSDLWSGKQPSSTSRSEFLVSNLDSFLENKNSVNEFTMPRLTRDAGHMVFSATESLDISGRVLTAGAEFDTNGDGQVDFQGRGAQVDIVASSLMVGNDSQNTGFDGVIINAADLEKLNAESLLLGGTRQLADNNEVRVTVSAHDITVNDNLTAPEIILAADAAAPGGTSTNAGVITINSDIKSSGTVAGKPRDIVLSSADGALLRVSEGSQVNVRRETITGNKGALTVNSQGSITSTGSIDLDATGQIQLDGKLNIENGSLSVGAQQINMGDVPQNTPGFVLTNDFLSQLSLNELVLVSNNALNIYGNASVGVDANNETLVNTINVLTNGIRGLNNSGNTQLVANTITIGNSRSHHDKSSGEIIVGDGQFNIDGYGQVIAAAESTLVADGNGELSANSDLIVKTPKVIATSGSDTTIVANGHNVSIVGNQSKIPESKGSTLSLSARNINSASVQKNVSELGGKLTVEGDSVDLDTSIEMPSGYVSLTANNGDVTLNDNAFIDVAGVTRTFGNAYSVDTWGGVTQLSADNGNVKISENARIDVSGANAQGSTGGNDAGRIYVTALGDGIDSGFADIKGILLANAQSAYRSGFISVDSQHVGDSAAFANALDKQQYLNAQFAQLNSQLEQGQFNESRSFRLRQGDIGIENGVVIHAHNIILSADNGNINIDGALDASGEKAGNIGVYAQDNLTVNSNAQLNVSATGADQSGGSVTLSTISGEINIEATSADHAYSINTAGTRQAQLPDGTPVVDSQGQPVYENGTVRLRAPRNVTNDDVNVGKIDGIIADASRINIEAVSTYTDADLNTPDGVGGKLVTATDIQNINTETQNFMANAATILKRINSPNASKLRVVPEVDVTSDQNLTLGADWDLDQWRYGDNNDPGVLSLSSSKNLTITHNIVDGFEKSVNTGNKEKLINGESWSYRLVAGADKSSANPEDIISGAGNFTLGTASAGNKIRTGTGDITIVSGGDVTWENKSSVIFTAGSHTMDADTPTFFDDKARTKEWPVNGGNINLRAAGDINSAQSDQLAVPWLWRQGGGTKQGQRVKTEWAIDIPKFAQGVAAFGGGNVNVEAGGNITNLSVSIPTTGKQLSSDPSDIKQWGGGDLYVRSGGDIKGGAYYVGRGAGDIFAQGGMVKGGPASSGIDVPLILLVGDAQFNLKANQNIMLGTATNPTVLPTIPGRDNYFNSVFFTYTEDSAVRLSSLAGDITFQTDSALVGNGGLLAPFKNSLAINSSSYAMQIFPGTLEAYAMDGNISNINVIDMYPSAKGQLELIAGGDVVMSLNLTMSDANPKLLPNPENPISSNIISASIDDMLTKSHNNTPLHGNDFSPVYIIADSGNIEGIYFLPKQANLIAGNDIQALQFVGQNIHDTDITLINAGRDIHYLGELDSIPKITVGGPGRLDVVAGRNINLGGSDGITTFGNLKNSALPNTGADVNVLVGVNKNSSYQDFIASYFKVDPKLYTFTDAMRTQSGKSSLSDSEALDYFNGLSNKDEVLANLNFSDNDLQLITGIITYDTNLSNFVSTIKLRRGDDAISTAQAFDIYNQMPPEDQKQIQDQLNQSDQELVGLQASFDYQVDAVRLVDTLNGGSSRTNDTASIEVSSDALLQFANLTPQQQRSVVIKSFFNELRDSGRYAINSDTPTDYSRADEAIATLFPPDQKYQGDLSMFASRIYTLAGGDINLLVPGGYVNGGLAVPTKEPNQLGVVTQQQGSIRAFTNGDFIVNQSRVFTLLGGDIIMWSSFGDIDAGRGAKSAISAPPPTVAFTPEGNTIIQVAGAVAGSGIRAITVDNSVNAGDVDLYAPNGTINAGDAGIGANNLYAGAREILGANNIDIGGQAFGVPALTPPQIPTDFGGATDISEAVKQSTENSIANAADDSTKTPLADAALSYLEVFVIGLGDESVGIGSDHSSQGDQARKLENNKR